MQAHSAHALGRHFLVGYHQFAHSIIHTPIPYLFWLISGSSWAPGTSVPKKKNVLEPILMFLGILLTLMVSLDFSTYSYETIVN